MLLWFAVSSLLLSFFVIREAQHDFPFFTWDDLHGCIEMPVVPGLPGIQLVGDMTVTRRYGMFHFGAPSASVRSVTVLYDDHHYFLVEATRDGFFRSLIDKSRFPNIAIAPLERHPIGATTSDGAVDEAKRFLKNYTGPWY
jgi:hypothetical protein